MSDSEKKNNEPAVSGGESILPVIAEKERELENLLREAQEEADRHLAEVRKEQGDCVAKEREKIAVERERMIQEALSEVESEIEQIRGSAEAEAATLRRRAEKRMEKAVEAALRLLLPGGNQQ
jgi:vacuolar-type H+-ATPase subunit H